MYEFWRRFQGRILGDRYRIESYIGCGAMGGVFRARDQRLRRSVALKLIETAELSPGLAIRNRRRFAREAEVAAGIASPHVVVVHDYGSDGTLDYLVMELLDGVNLKDWLARNPSPPVDLRLELIRQAAIGLAAGHASAIVHRDVKPSNLLVTPQPGGGVRVKLVDFGIAKPVDAPSGEGTITSPGEFVGTPRYASPEQLRGEVNLTPSSDVFSLGILAYTLVTGLHPFTDDDRTRLFNGSQVHVLSPRRHTPELPDALCDLILRALNVSPANRPRNAGAFADELAAVMRSSTLTAMAPSLIHAFSDRTVEWPTPVRHSLLRALTGWLARIPPPVRWLPARPNPMASLGIVAALMVGGAGLGFTILRPDGTDPEKEPTSARADLAQTRIAARKANDAGLGLDRSGDAQAALDQFRRAVELQPDHEEYLDNLGYALRKVGRPHESVTLLKSVVKQYPTRVSAHYNLAESYLETGDTTQAIEHLRHYVSLADSKRAESARRKIRKLRGR